MAEGEIKTGETPRTKTDGNKVKDPARRDGQKVKDPAKRDKGKTGPGETPRTGPRETPRTGGEG